MQKAFFILFLFTSLSSHANVCALIEAELGVQYSDRAKLLRGESLFAQLKSENDASEPIHFVATETLKDYRRIYTDENGENYLVRLYGVADEERAEITDGFGRRIDIPRERFSHHMYMGPGRAPDIYQPEFIAKRIEQARTLRLALTRLPKDVVKTLFAPISAFSHDSDTVKRRAVHAALYTLLALTGNHPFLNYINQQEDEDEEKIKASRFQWLTGGTPLWGGENVAILEFHPSNDSLDGTAKVAKQWRFRNGNNVKVVEGDSLEAAIEELTKQVEANEKPFDRVEILIHGVMTKDASGKLVSVHKIAFPARDMGKEEIKKLTPKRCLVRGGGTLVLQACAPAEGKEGTELLQALGGVFLPDGGTAYGSTKIIEIDEHLLADAHPKKKSGTKYLVNKGMDHFALPLTLIKAMARDAKFDDWDPAVKKVTIRPKK